MTLARVNNLYTTNDEVYEHWSNHNGSQRYYNTMAHVPIWDLTHTTMCICDIGKMQTSELKLLR